MAATLDSLRALLQHTLEELKDLAKRGCALYAIKNTVRADLKLSKWTNYEPIIMRTITNGRDRTKKREMPTDRNHPQSAHRGQIIQPPISLEPPIFDPHYQKRQCGNNSETPSCMPELS
ncbi:unnamed protein product [Periconia digitata]|uniref:Uncharacterized protein n=1 Tax=Periconia digitata TaxID=1303443 RepID=A0A9W4UUT9_9PLEO|nr:unnamed protein product [Periconia digitata]